MGYLFSKASRLILGPSQPYIQWAMGALYPGVKWHRGVAHLNLVQSLRVSGAIPPCSHMPSCWVQKQLHLTRPSNEQAPFFFFKPVNITGHFERVYVPLVLNICIRTEKHLHYKRENTPVLDSLSGANPINLNWKRKWDWDHGFLVKGVRNNGTLPAPWLVITMRNY